MVTDQNGDCNAQKLINDEIIERGNLNYIEKEAYSHIAVHIASVAHKDLKQFLVLSNGTDVAMYTLVYFHLFKTTNVNKIWMKFGIHKRQRHSSLPISRDLRNRKIASAA